MLKKAGGWPNLITGVLLGGLLLASCSIVASTPPISPDLGPRETTSTAPAPSTTTTTEKLQLPHPPNSLPAPAGVLITPSGVVVALLEQTGDHFAIRTPCGNEVTVQGGTPVGDIEVVIDPGHGGAVDPGAVGANGLTEAALNIRVSRVVQRLLEDRGITTLLTRTADYTTTLGVRTALADNSGARLMISVHHNAPTANLGTEPGTEVFIQSDSTDSRRLGGLVYERLVEELSQFDVRWSIAPDAGVLQVHNIRGIDAYGLIRNPETVSALVEIGYISNPQEAELFVTEEYVSAAASALVEAIETYLRSDLTGSGFIETPRVFTPQRGISGSVCEDPDLY